MTMVRDETPVYLCTGAVRHLVLKLLDQVLLLGEGVMARLDNAVEPHDLRGEILVLLLLRCQAHLHLLNILHTTHNNGALTSDKIYAFTC